MTDRSSSHSYDLIVVGAGVVGCSVAWHAAKLGAGRVLVTEIDGYPVEVSGNLHTIVLVANDVKGSVARIAGILADANVNIATLKLSRKERGGDAFMVIEVDEQPGEDLRDSIRALPWVTWAFRLDKVSA
jgi:L-serine dehydratase